MTTDIALRLKLDDILAEYEEKKSSLPAMLDAFEKAGEALKMASTVSGTYGRANIDVGRNYIETLEKNLRVSAWLTVYNAPGVKMVMSANDQERFESFVQDPPDFTVEEIRAQFGDHILNPWANILRGLAEVFSDLDQSFKSHERVKIGVKGLPKRIIVRGFAGYSGHGWKKIRDVFNAIASLRREELLEAWPLEQALRKDGKHYWEERGLELRTFENGNGHLHFSPATLEVVNRGLAAFYGDVLPDAVTPKPTKRATSTAVSKDLQYYPTPVAVVDRVLAGICGRDIEYVLEPSCGCGRFLDGIRKAFPGRKVHGIEVDMARALEARRKGHNVRCVNFLEVVPEPIYDLVVMNPPFYGKHYAQHVEHALKFLKPGGRLHSVLPITARTDHGLVEKMGRCQWRDLPVGAFRESGTNINTTVVTMWKPA